MVQIKLGDKLMNNITQWLNGTKTPTFNQIEDFRAITDMAGYFRCGEIVIARKALDCNKITQDVYNKVVQTAVDNYNRMKENKESSGGNYYNTMGARLDECFVRALCESINMGRTSYAEAYRLTKTSRKTFSDVVQHFGGVEW